MAAQSILNQNEDELTNASLMVYVLPGTGPKSWGNTFFLPQKKLADDIFAYAQAKAVNEGKKWDGFKVVEGRSSRKYADEAKVAEVCRENGYALSQIFKSTLIGITDMEKLMGKKQFKELLGEYVHKPKGKLTLVPVSDKREEISTISEFMED